MSLLLLNIFILNVHRQAKELLSDLETQVSSKPDLGLHQVQPELNVQTDLSDILTSQDTG